MTTKIKWRLSKLPDSHEVSLLLEKGVLTKEEAREILFSLETEEDRDKASLQEEIKFLRALVDKMSTRSQILTYIPQVATPNYTNKPWWSGYQVYCDSSNGSATTGLVTDGLTNAIGSGTSSISLNGLTSGTNSLYTSTSASGTSAIYSYSEPSFNDISTF